VKALGPVVAPFVSGRPEMTFLKLIGAEGL